MSERVKRNLQVLRAVALMKPKQRKLILKAADKELIQSLCECALNLLRGNIKIDTNKKVKLSRFKTVLRRLVKSGESFKKKKSFIVQKGGGILFPLLINAVLQAILN